MRRLVICKVMKLQESIHCQCIYFRYFRKIIMLIIENIYLYLYYFSCSCSVYVLIFSINAMFHVRIRTISKFVSVSMLPIPQSNFYIKSYVRFTEVLQYWITKGQRYKPSLWLLLGGLAAKASCYTSSMASKGHCYRPTAERTDLVF